MPQYAGAKDASSTALGIEGVSIVMALRGKTLLRLPTIYLRHGPPFPTCRARRCVPTCSATGLAACHNGGVTKGLKRKFKSYPTGYFHVDIAHPRTASPFSSDHRSQLRIA